MATPPLGGWALASWWRRRLPLGDAARVDALLESFGLSALAHSRPAALNPMLRQDLRRELAQLCAGWQTPVVIITHDIGDVLALADVAFVSERAVRMLLGVPAHG